MAVVYRPEFRSDAEHGRIDAITQAERMIPDLRARASEARAARRLPGETQDAFRASGLARILQPRRFGGAEAPIVSLVDVLIPVGAGCGSSAWVLAQYLMHNFMVARWPEEAQAAIWGTRPDCLISGILVPLHGTAHRVSGGFLLSGRWSLVSGVEGSDWCILSARVESVKGPAEDYNCIVPTAAVEILDTWYPVGLHGSGSQDVRVDGLFVPEAMALATAQLNGGQAPGAAINKAAIYRLPVYMTFGTLLASAVLGMAEQMFEEFLTHARVRTSVMNANPVSSFATSHVDVGEISATLQAAESLLRADCAEMMEIAESQRVPGDKERTNYRCNAAFAARCASRVASLIVDLIGGPGSLDGNLISRVHQDIFVATRHSNLNWNANAVEHGRARFRLPLTNGAL